MLLVSIQVGGLIHGLAPNASEAYRRSMDQKALPEVLKCLSTEGFPELLAHLRDLVPGARTYSHGHGDDGSKPDQVCGDAAHPDAVDVSLDDAFVERPSTFDAENPMHEDAGAPPAPDLAPRPSVGIELKEVTRPKPWGERPRFEKSPEELPLKI